MPALDSSHDAGCPWTPWCMLGQLTRWQSALIPDEQVFNRNCEDVRAVSRCYWIWIGL